jgi:hypothetical protein
MDPTASRRPRVFREEEPGAHPKAHSTAAPKTARKVAPPDSFRAREVALPSSPFSSHHFVKEAFAGPAPSVPFSGQTTVIITG